MSIFEQIFVYTGLLLAAGLIGSGLIYRLWVKRKITYIATKYKEKPRYQEYY